MLVDRCHIQTFLQRKFSNLFEQKFVINWIFKFGFFMVLIDTSSVGIAFANEHEYQHGTLRISSLYIRGTIQGRPAAGYMTIDNLGTKSDKLTSVSSPMAKRVELHKTSIENSVAKMLHMPHLPLPPKSTIILKPGSFHLMVMGLRKPLVANSLFPMTLNFSIGGRIHTKFKVEEFSRRKRIHEKR